LQLDIIRQFEPAKPYIKNIGDIPTEIKDTNTVTKRLKVELYDEKDNDVAVDPYLSDRTSVQGTYWKKWLARNKNYKGRIIELWEGFDGITEANFEMKFAGKVDNIKIKAGVATIEAVSLLRSLKDIKYPLKTDIKLTADVPDELEAANETEMLQLPAVENDYCRRTDFKEMTGITTSEVSGSLTPHYTYYFTIVAYDAQGKEFAKSARIAHTTSGSGVGIHISWAAVSGASEYYVYSTQFNTFPAQQDLIITSFTYHDLIVPYFNPFYTISTKSYLLYQLTAGDPTIIGNWTEIHTDLQIATNDASSLDSSGYIKIDKEIFYYSGKVGNVLTGVQRKQENTKADRHSVNTVLYSLLQKAPGNPFTHLKTLLGLGGITSAYIDSQFTTYEGSWTDINFGTNVIVKDTDLAEIYFDLVSIADCISWDGEDVKIKIKKQDELPGSYTTITDTANIIENSAKVDLNEESRKTRWLVFWNRTDVDKGLKDREAYDHLDMMIDSDAENSNSFGDIREDIQYTTWINLSSGTEASITSYIASLLAKRKDRTNRAQHIVSWELEMKDDGLKVGDLLKVDTDELQNPDGTDYSAVIFRMIRKAKKKISLKLY